MRLPLSTLLLMLLAAPALAATQADHDDCNAADAERNIAGCTRIIEDKTESDTVRGIAHVGRGLALLGKGEANRALADMTEAIRLNPNDALAYNNRALIRRDAGDIDNAIADFNEAIRINPHPRSDLPGVPQVSVYTNRGLAFLSKGDSDRALADFDQAISLNPEDAAAYHRRGEIRAARDEFETALVDLDQAIKLDPNNGSAFYVRGVTRFELYTYANPWIRIEELLGAIADFGETIRLMPDWAQGYYARGIAWRTNGDKERAIADLLEAARLNPTTPRIIQALKELKPDYQSAEDELGKLFKWPGSSQGK